MSIIDSSVNKSLENSVPLVHVGLCSFLWTSWKPLQQYPPKREITVWGQEEHIWTNFSEAWTGLRSRGVQAGPYSTVFLSGCLKSTSECSVSREVNFSNLEDKKIQGMFWAITTFNSVCIFKKYYILLLNVQNLSVQRKMTHGEKRNLKIK